MGFLDRLRGNSVEQSRAADAMPELPALSMKETSHRRGSGFFTALLLAQRGEQTVKELGEVRNVSRGDVLALIQSIQGTWRLAIELTTVEAEIDRASNGELSQYLSEDQYWFGDKWSRAIDERAIPHYSEQKIDWFQSFDCSHVRMTEWVDEHVSEPQRSDFLKLLERQAKLRDAVIKAAITFEQTHSEIAEAVRKSRIIAASERINVNVGEMAQPELEVENATAVQGLVNAVSEGLDEAYFAALGEQPELSELEQAGDAEQPKIDPAAWAAGQISL